MKVQILIALCATAQAGVLKGRDPQFSLPKMNFPPGVTWATFIGQGFELYNYATKVFADAKDQYSKGTPIAKVVDEVIPKMVPELKLLKRVQLEGEKTLREGSKKARAYFGPYNLVGKNDYRPMAEFMSLDPRGQGKVSWLTKGGLCGDEDCTILSARVGVAYEDGKEATPDTGVYIHHLLAFSASRPSVNAIGMCDVPEPQKDIGFLNKIISGSLPFSPFTGRGEDGGPVNMLFTSEDGKFNSGFHLGKEDRILVQSDLVNYKNESQSIYLTLDYEYVPGFQGTQAITTLLSVTGCLLIIPPSVNMTGRAVTKSRSFPILNDATLINMRGHMHDGGDKMVLAVNDKTVCESLPEYKGKELWSMTACGGPIDVKKGDYLTMTSVYDVSKHPLRPGVVGHSHAKNILGLNDLMGMYGVTFATKPRPQDQPKPKAATEMTAPQVPAASV